MNKKEWERNKLNCFWIVWCLTVATICISLFSKSSVLYPINDWVDAQCFFTVGKSMVRGVVPYRDLIEQKGPLMYFVYGVASLVSYSSFIGVYIIEIIAFSVFLIFVWKILLLYIDKKYIYGIIPMYAVCMCVTSAFSQGGAARSYVCHYLRQLYIQC